MSIITLSLWRTYRNVHICNDACNIVQLLLTPYRQTRTRTYINVNRALNFVYILLHLCLFIFSESCSRFCDNSGCWGPGADACVSCANYSLDGECVAKCDLANLFYVDAKQCLPCSVECLNSCTGPVGKLLYSLSLIIMLVCCCVFVPFGDFCKNNMSLFCCACATVVLALNQASNV